MKSLSRYEGYELIIPAGTTQNQINFPDIPELRSDSTQDTIVMSLEVYPAEALPNTYSGNACAPLAFIQNSFLTLYILGFQQFYRIPLIKAVAVRAATATADSYYFEPEPWEFNPIRIDWTKSYVSFANPPDNEDQLSLMFSFGYEWLPTGSYAKYLQMREANFAAGIIPIR